MVKERKRQLAQAGRGGSDAGDGGDGSERKWREEKQKTREEELKRLGLPPEASHRLDSAETAEAVYRKTHKVTAPRGYESFNQTALYAAYEKRAAAIQPDLASYEAAKAADPEFYRAGDSLRHGGAGVASEAGVDRMVAELAERQKKAAGFSRRRAFSDARDVDYINPRNAHFNKKIDRAFGKHTAEIKANLERGTALPDR